MAIVRTRKTRALLAVAAALTGASLIAGCAAPGEPSTRRPPIPDAIGDLSAKQQGNNVVLTFTVPNESIDRHPLKSTPTVELYRNASAASAAANAQAALTAPSKPVLLATLPPATVDQLKQNRAVTFAEPLSAEDFAAGPSVTAVYVIRTYEREKKPSADSNAVAITLHPAYPPIADAKAENAPDGVSVNWTPPQQTITGTTPPIVSYRVYRAPAADATASATAVATKGAEAPKLKSPLQRVGDAAAPPFLDSQIELGTRYVYSVRSVVAYGAEQLEASDSNLTEITARDTFPPSTPEGLIVALIPGQPAAANSPAVAAYLDLSWAIAPEHDVTGYNVYRSDSSGEAGKRQNADLLPTPVFRDMNTLPGHVYYYRVTAVDRAGNESAASAPAQGSTTEDAQPGPQNQ
jgi:hypothetical protein